MKLRQYREDTTTTPDRTGWTPTLKARGNTNPAFDLVVHKLLT